MHRTEAKRSAKERRKRVPSRLLILGLLGGLAAAQAAPSSFSGNSQPASSNATEPTSESESSGPANHFDQLPQLLPQPIGKATLIGGTIFKVDVLRDEITIKVFGGQSTRVLFDTRTHIFCDGLPASTKDLKSGERIYVDTMLAGTSVFAKNIRLLTQGAQGQSSGQIESYDPRTGELVLSDAISPQSVRLLVSANTSISREGRTVPASELVPGTLVSIAFQPNAGREPVARQVSILANPGNAFVFVGSVVQLDVHIGLLVLVDPRNQRSYEIRYDPRRIHISDNLQEGATVEVTTTFDGNRYMASNIKVNSTPNH
jgi:hypothetical protein